MALPCPENLLSAPMSLVLWLNAEILMYIVHVHVYLKWLSEKTGFLPFVIQMWNGEQDVQSRNVAHQWFWWLTGDFQAWLERV